MLLFTLLASSLFFHSTIAFPPGVLEALNRGEELLPRDGRSEHLKRQAPVVTPPFDAAVQYVNNQGANAFNPPGGFDQRGPCPGLNAMANHGYLPHNGVATIQEFIDGTAAAFGMGTDLAALIATYGAVFDGDLTKWSIGGPYPGLVNLGALLVSLSYPLHLHAPNPSAFDTNSNSSGNDYLLQTSQFRALYALGQQNANNIDLSVLTTYRTTRFQESISSNPYFFNAPFSGVIAQPAAWSFIYRFMANKSAEAPEGILDGETLKSFYSIEGTYPDFTYTPGHERIPDNWYKRNPVDYYTIPYFSVDLNAMALQHPEFLSVGGNTGTTNSFVGIDPANLTDGVFNAGNLLQGNNLICFGLQASLMEAPDLLSGLYSDIDPAVDKLGTAINQATDGLGCPQLNKIDKGQFERFPGYTKLKRDGTY
ncbi:MAG: hypothetical protein Q9160_008631 [Pyrenula sp. 1 TL-2023]